MKPTLRFKGFDGEWERGPLKTCGIINPSGLIPEEFNYVDLESVVGTSLLQTRRLSKSEAPSRAQRLAKQGDIFYQTVRPYQKNNYLFVTNAEDFVFSTGYAQIRPSINGLFLFTVLQQDAFVDEVLLNCTGTSYPAINATALSNIDIVFPSTPTEQAAIGSYFKELDSMIAASTARLSRLEQVKRGSLQAMFPLPGQNAPALRFKGFTGEWIKTTIGQIATFAKGQGYSKSDLSTSGNPIILYGRLYTQYETIIDNVDTFAALKEGSVISKGGEVIIPASGETAEDIAVASVVMQPGVILGGDLNIINVNQNVADSAFIALAATYSNTHKELSGYAQGKSVVHINNGNIAKATIQLPTKAEQEAIGAYFKELDRQLQLEGAKLGKLRQLKQASLSQLFV